MEQLFAKLLHVKPSSSENSFVHFILLQEFLETHPVVPKH